MLRETIEGIELLVFGNACQDSLNMADPKRTLQKTHIAPLQETKQILYERPLLPRIPSLWAGPPWIAQDTPPERGSWDPFPPAHELSYKTIF